VVRREGDHLSVQENCELKEELFPETEKDFFAKVADDVFSFETDAQGRVTGMLLHTGGENIPLKRIDQRAAPGPPARAGSAPVRMI
jgi:hypothetical protein